MRRQWNYTPGQQSSVVVRLIITWLAFIMNEAAAIAGHEVARNNLGIMEDMSGNREQAVKHWMIAASAGCYRATHELVTNFGLGRISRELIDSTLAAYNNSCVEMRSEARDAYIRAITE
jgi:hypothetical protein